jgi:hypothetical protein
METMSIEQLLERLTSTSIPASERMKALCCIGACATAAAADSLERTLTAVLYRNTNPIVRHEAAFILGKLYRAQRIRGTRALIALCEAANSDESVVVRHEALEVLAAFPHQRALNALQKRFQILRPTWSLRLSFHCTFKLQDATQTERLLALIEPIDGEKNDASGMGFGRLNTARIRWVPSHVRQ